jgi:hypothetical protein
MTVYFFWSFHQRERSAEAHGESLLQILPTKRYHRSYTGALLFGGRADHGWDGEFLNLKASHHESPRATSLEDHHAKGCAKIEGLKHRSQQEPTAHVQLPNRFRRRQFEVPSEAVLTARIRNPPEPRVGANLFG